MKPLAAYDAVGAACRSPPDPGPVPLTPPPRARPHSPPASLAPALPPVPPGPPPGPAYSRTPATLAQAAAGLDALSGGRFTLGLGASGPQVIEGFHGVPYTMPLTRLSEIIEICRMAWKREPLSYNGKVFTLPMPPGEGTGLGKALKIINHPVREDIPIYVASLGARSVEEIGRAHV